MKCCQVIAIKHKDMKKVLLVSALLLMILWAVMFFVIKTGEVTHVIAAVAAIILLFLYSMRRVLT